MPINPATLNKLNQQCKILHPYMHLHIQYPNLNLISFLIKNVARLCAQTRQNLNQMLEVVTS